MISLQVETGLLFKFSALRLLGEREVGALWLGRFDEEPVVGDADCLSLVWGCVIMCMASILAVCGTAPFFLLGN
ncbi:MAG: hypothetical protein NT018_05480 [Armatimonadetes bacterium]|nr:hypothetical protein [Armatimonadota bacterium]